MTNVTVTELQEETGLYDMKNLGKMKMLGANAAEAMGAFVAFDHAALAGRHSSKV